METPFGPIWESNAIAKYVARMRNDTGLLGSSFHEHALVDQWLDFVNNEVPFFLFFARVFFSFAPSHSCNHVSVFFL